MKNSFLVAIVILTSSHLFAANKLHCVVNKFTPNTKSQPNINQKITFRATIDPGQFLLVDENGATEVQPDYKPNETRNIYWVSSITPKSVFISLFPDNFSSLSENFVTVTSHQKGIALTCIFIKIE
jgi:hypothetical protein